MLYNNETLLKHCFDNDIHLEEDYTTVKVNRECIIKGACKTTTEKCNKIFNKNFRQLVKTGPYCLICAVENGKQKLKLKCKYNLEHLTTFCNENNIVLICDYTNKFINRDTFIEGNCLTRDCNDVFNRSFRELEKFNGYCANCCKEKGKIKLIETNLEKFGYDSAMKNADVKNKQKNTMLKIYGVERVSQLDSYKQIQKEKNLEKYGVEYSLQSKMIRDKGIETNILRYGVKNPQQNIDIKNKTMETNLNKYGCKSAVKNPIVKQKMMESNILKYGVPHHSQNPEIAEHMLKSAYNNKKYTLPSGKIIDYQGYENFAFDELLNIEHILEEDMITSRKEVPEIWYNDKTNKKRRHFVDIYIKSQNRCIEVKSRWTNQEKNNVFEKQAAAIELRYKYEIWIYNEKGNKLETH